MLSVAWQPILKQQWTAVATIEITAIFALHSLTPIGLLPSKSQAIHEYISKENGM
jgi:hypothetical protein